VTSNWTRSIAIAAAGAVSAGLLISATLPAAAFDAGALSSVVNGFDPTSTSGTNDSIVQVTAPAPCDASATRHVLQITAVTATSPAQQSLADAWVGDNLYAPVGVGLPGPLTVQSSSSWQGLANAFSQTLVAGVYQFVLRCQDNLGTVIFEEWSGGVTFSSPTAWTGFTGGAPGDTTAPHVSMTGPASTTTLGTSTVATWNGTDAVGVTSYDVRYRRAAWNGSFGAYVNPAALQGTTVKSATFALGFGTTYCFSVRARDAAANVSAYSAPRCTAKPLDDRSLKAKGNWKKKTGSAYYAGTFVKTKSEGAKLIRKGAVAGRCALVATKGKHYGKVGIYYNGKLVKTVKLSAKHKTNRVIIALPSLTKTTKIQIKVLTSGKKVLIDGLVLARS
jgi:hypothetical protein